MASIIQSNKQYLIGLCLVLGAGLVCLGLFNRLMNPYDYFDHLSIKGINAHRNYGEQLRLRRPIQIFQRNPSILIVGDSRSGRGFRCHDITNNPASCYNASIQGITNQETYRLLEHAIATSPVKEVWWELNFYNFLATQPYRAGFIDGLYMRKASGISFPFYKNLLDQYFFSLFSYQALNDSLRSLNFQNIPFGWFAADIAFMEADGSWGSFEDPNTLKNLEKLRQKKIRSWNFALDKLDRALVGTKKELDHNPHLLEKNLQAFGDILNLLYKNNIQTRIIITTGHIRYTESKKNAELIPISNLWKKDMVTINAKLADKNNKAPFNIFDVADVSLLTTEPDWNELQEHQQMNWFADPTHFNELFGEQIISAILNAPQETEVGTLINPKNIDTYLAKMNASLTDHLTSAKNK